MLSTRQIGQLGEAVAIRYYRSRGGVVIKHNYYTPYGEIDLIIFFNKLLIFSEVKLLRQGLFGAPQEMVRSKKVENLSKSVDFFLTTVNWPGNIRFEVCAINLANSRARISIFEINDESSPQIL